MSQNFQGRLGVIQRVLPHYRVPFFEALATQCTQGLTLFAGDPRNGEGIQPPTHTPAFDWAKVRNHHLLSGRLYACWQAQLLKNIQQDQPNALIVEANPRYLSTPAVLRWAHRQALPLIGWGLGAPPINGLLAGFRQVSRWRFIRQFDALITYSEKGAQEYRALGFPAERVFVARNAVTPRPRHAMPRRPDQFVDGTPRLLYVGRLQPRKRLDALLKACATLPPERQPLLKIVGDGDILPDLKALAQSIYPKAEFTGALYDAALAEAFTWADAFVLPGTGGLAIQQAMAYALPVIVAEADGTQTDLVRPENGWQLPANDDAALLQALNEAFQHPQKLRRMGAAGYRIVSQEINLESMVDVFLQALACAQTLTQRQP